MLLLNPVVGLDHVPVEQIAVIGRFAIPSGGLARDRLAAGENLIVSGATGHFGSGGDAHGGAATIATPKGILHPAESRSIGELSRPNRRFCVRAMSG